jgi:hypothetical protein
MILNVIINHRGLFRVAPVLMNQRSRNGEAVTPGDGNSGYLKWVPYPFQITDAIPRVVPRIFYKALTKRYHGYNRALPTWCKNTETVKLCYSIVNALVKPW